MSRIWAAVTAWWARPPYRLDTAEALRKSNAGPALDVLAALAREGVS